MSQSVAEIETFSQWHTLHVKLDVPVCACTDGVPSLRQVAWTMSSAGARQPFNFARGGLAAWRVGGVKSDAHGLPDD